MYVSARKLHDQKGMNSICREFHREQLSIEHSMRDLDSAVGRLDDILMSLYVVIAVLIVAVSLVGDISGNSTGKD